jgi:Ca2+-transporting ATPase
MTTLHKEPGGGWLSITKGTAEIIPVFVQLGHVLAVRSEETSLWKLGLLSNRPLAGAVALTVVLQFAVVYLQPLNAIFRTVPLTAGQLGIAVGAAAAILAVVETEKFFRRRSRGG